MGGWHDDGRELAIGIVSARSPADVYSVDVTTKSWGWRSSTRTCRFAKKQNQDFQFYATVAFVKEYLLK